ncbi:hypothetical protein WDU94_012553 [Cyamophila willieti]
MDYSNAGGGDYGETINMAPKGAPRPRVDPEYVGEVDPSAYPMPKEATHKIRGKSDVIELLFGAVDQELLTVKTFYFFFYSAFGSLFPLMGVYFKQMGMNPSQCGLLIGSRPFVEFLAAPFWGSLADRWHKGKTILLVSLSCWIIFTLPLGFIQPPATSCIIKNHTEYILAVPDRSLYKRTIRSVDEGSFQSSDNSEGLVDDGSEYLVRITRSTKPQIYAGKSPYDVKFASNYDEKKQSSWVSPLFSRIVYQTQDIQKAFFLLILLVVIGEFFSAPAITLADSAVITILGEDADRYGHQRMFGPFGREKNYTICFATFSVLMGAALITATQINFKYEELPEQDEMLGKPQQTATKEDYMQQQLAQQLNLPSLAPQGLPPQDPNFAVNGPPAPSLGETKMFAKDNPRNTRMGHRPQAFPEHQMRPLSSSSPGSWDLESDYGGSPTLFGVASVINHISEIFAYFFSFKLIRQVGHVKVLCLGLMGNILRFLYISWLKNPWWVLPFEFMQGITHAAVWAACCSYIAHNTPQQLRSSAQGVLQGIHHGLGRGCGAVIGGIFVNSFGTTATFRGYGICCAGVLGAFIFINFYRKEVGGFVSELPVTEDPHQVAEETAHLAPHGVPSNPIPRALSSNRLHELGDNQGYGATYNTSASGNLDLPGQGGGYNTNPFPTATNPFRQDLGPTLNYNFNFFDPNDEENIRKKFQLYNEVFSRYDEENKVPKVPVEISNIQPINTAYAYDW